MKEFGRVEVVADERMTGDYQGVLHTLCAQQPVGSLHCEGRTGRGRVTAESGKEQERALTSGAVLSWRSVKSSLEQTPEHPE